eukprot:s10927_g1.t1
MLPHRLSRHGPVTVEVSAALTAMDCGVELTRVWRELDNYVGTVVENDRERVVETANDLADRMLRAQVGLAETLYKREWNENTAPMMSVLLPGTRSGGTTACRFDHPDQHSNGPMSSLRMRMHSLGIQTEATAMRRWVAGGPGGNARVKLANYFNRQFTDHVSTFEWDNTGLDNWRWRTESESFDTVGIARVPMTDP